MASVFLSHSKNCNVGGFEEYFTALGESFTHGPWKVSAHVAMFEFEDVTVTFEPFRVTVTQGSKFPRSTTYMSFVYSRQCDWVAVYLSKTLTGPGR